MRASPAHHTNESTGRPPRRPGNRLQNGTLLVVLAGIALLFFVGIMLKVGLFGL